MKTCSELTIFFECRQGYLLCETMYGP